MQHLGNAIAGVMGGGKSIGRAVEAAGMLVLPPLALELLKKYVDLPIDAQALCTLAAMGVSMCSVGYYLIGDAHRKQGKES
jgi:hypothetical protein